MAYLEARGSTNDSNGGQRTNIRRWLYFNGGTIRSILEDACGDYQAKEHPDKRLSELGLCATMFDLPMPDGFFVVNTGKLEIVNHKNNVIASREHVFAVNGSTILCVTFAQMYDLQFPNQTGGLRAGDRIARYREMAPELIFLLDNQIAALSGTVDEVKRQTHLVYTW